LQSFLVLARSQPDAHRVFRRKPCPTSSRSALFPSAPFVAVSLTVISPGYRRCRYNPDRFAIPTATVPQHAFSDPSADQRRPLRRRPRPLEPSAIPTTGRCSTIPSPWARAARSVEATGVQATRAEEGVMVSKARPLPGPAVPDQGS
jgi:hypothetical protein